MTTTTTTGIAPGEAGPDGPVPPGPGSRPPGRGPRRRTVRLAVALVLVALVAVGITGRWLLARSVPVGGGVAGVEASSVEVEVIDNVLGLEYRVIAPEPGDEITMYLMLRNDGPLPITVLSLRSPFNPDGVVDRFGTAEMTDAGSAIALQYGSEAIVERELPITLSSGDGAEIHLSFSILDCATDVGAPGSSTWTTRLPVTYRVLGLTRTVDVDLGYAISVESDPRCPPG